MNWQIVFVLATVMTMAPHAQGQEDPEPSDPTSIEDISALENDSATAELPSDEPAKSDDESANKSDASDNSPVEEEGKTYRFLGLRYRGVILPDFVLNNYVDGGSTLYFNGIGPELSMRKNGTEFSLSTWLLFMSMDPTVVKGSGEPDTDWSLVSSDLKIFYVSVDIMGSKQLRPDLALLYGGGAGLGGVFGDVIRNEMTPPAGNPAAPLDQWVTCAAGQMDAYCSGDHPPNYSEPNWFNHGSKPVVFPWLALQTGLRYKPHRKFVARLDLGVSITGIFFGLAADYGL